MVINSVPLSLSTVIVATAALTLLRSFSLELSVSAEVRIWK